MLNKGFEGWYFRHQLGDKTIAFIPGRTENSSFVQVIDEDGSKQFEIKKMTVDKRCIFADESVFSEHGIIVDLPEIKGQISYDNLTKLRSDIMGPFRFFPMECRHGVISMCHDLSGYLTVSGVEKSFDGGRGYIEKDSGTSFPSSYLWVQCHDFPEKCSIMLSIANIPFARRHFTGCICALIIGEREYRLATYNGVKIFEMNRRRVRLSQGNLRLEVEILSATDGYSLKSPVNGDMSGLVRECTNASIRVRLWEKEFLVFDHIGSNAGYECTGI